ncbi:transposase [Streptococcus pneumoniae]|nr:transposase [Streptococcus pneumoniae]
MQDNYTTKGKHLTIDSRRLIERWKKEGKSNREIASLLGKAPQTIHTKIKRRTVRKCLGKGRFKEVYSADYAQQSYENNRKRSVKKSSLTKELKEKRLRNRLAPTLNLLVNPSNSGLKLSIFAWRMGIMRLIRFYLRERKTTACLTPIFHDESNSKWLKFPR